jgi:N-dimethylarginine dimethylaminohydrolase
MLNLKVNSETSKLKSVVVGIANDRGNHVHENNPKISKYLLQGKLPSEDTLIKEVDYLAELISNEGIEVFRPENVESQDQIFARDIGFVIGEYFILSRMKKSNRVPEQKGLSKILSKISPDKILYPPDNATIEGGDVLVNGKYIFVGLTERTNYYGLKFIKNSFPNYEVIPFHMYVTDNPATNILHLDCAFQPVGDRYAILYENGFVHTPDQIYDIYGSENIIKVTQFEMYHMFPNIFSLAPDKVISDKSFKRLNEILDLKGIQVIETDYQEVGKFGGLFRCSTMPLIRE